MSNAAGKYLPKVFVLTERRRSEVCGKKPKANTLPPDQADEVL